MALVAEFIPFYQPAVAGGTIARGAVVTCTTDNSDGNLTVIVAASKDVIPFGVALESASSGDSLKIATIPGSIVNVKADGAFSKGDLLAVTDSDGTVDTWSETGGDLSYVIGVALHAAGAAGDLIPCRLMLQAATEES